MPKYQNTSLVGSRSTFSEVTAGTDQLVVSNQYKSAPVKGGGAVRFLNGAATLNRGFTPDSCDPCQSAMLNASVKLQWNVVDADQLGALRTELNRVIDAAIANYNLTAGLTPPVFADFEA